MIAVVVVVIVNVIVAMNVQQDDIIFSFVAYLYKQLVLLLPPPPLPPIEGTDDDSDAAGRYNIFLRCFISVPVRILARAIVIVNVNLALREGMNNLLVIDSTYMLVLVLVRYCK